MISQGGGSLDRLPKSFLLFLLNISCDDSAIYRLILNFFGGSWLTDSSSGLLTMDQSSCREFGLVANLCWKASAIDPNLAFRAANATYMSSMLFDQ